jgi:hypothetical protein
MSQVESDTALCNILFFWGAVGVFLHIMDFVQLDARTLIVFVLGYFGGHLYTYRMEKMFQMELFDTKIKCQEELREIKSECQEKGKRNSRN